MTTSMSAHVANAHHEKLLEHLKAACNDVEDSMPTIEMIALLSNFIGQIIGSTAVSNEAVLVGIDTVKMNLEYGIKEAILQRETVHGNA